MPTVDFEKQPVLGREVIGHAAWIGSGGLRNVANRDCVKPFGGKQFLRGAQDRLAHVRLARGNFVAVGRADHLVQMYKWPGRVNKYLGKPSRATRGTRAFAFSRTPRSGAWPRTLGGW